MLGATVRLARDRSPLGVVWLGAAIGTAIICYVAPFNRLPGFDNREMLWTPGQQLIGASYPLLGYALILLYALPSILPKRAATVSEAVVR
jgi:alpha-1,2-mannosyltransferase